ncbi:hypothetical protein B4U79_17290 [Dinothrombium tinctorium]|uniref:Arginine deiminase-like protein n=1 Tax=Dinothrombium tinctorium TaxID=1965070 RepID=A0A3S3PKL5_9ACAR|nr:hypothetical protein B4U79_17290 [Dinothrombium tinctorium]
MFSSLHPEAALYESTVTVKSAAFQHSELRKALRSQGAQVHLLTDVLFNRTQEDEDAFNKLRELANSSFVYDTTHLEDEYNSLKEMTNKFTGQKRSNFYKTMLEFRHKLDTAYQEKYRQEILQDLNANALINIIINRPTIVLHLQHWFDGDLFFLSLRQEVKLNSLNNLYFMRDQQITTNRGIVLLRSVTRASEKEVTRFAFKKLGFDIVGELTRGYAEGGDFLPAGDLVFIGQGLRTTADAVEEMLEKDYFGANEVAVVRDYQDFGAERLHLDTFFNILTDKDVLILEDVLNDNSKKRFVDLYVKNDTSAPKIGNYTKIISKMEFGQFLRRRGFKITTVTNEEQLNFAVNFLNLGNGNIVTPYGEPLYLDRLRKLGINVQYVDISTLTAGNGAVHCMTQVISRQRKAR